MIFEFLKIAFPLALYLMTSLLGGFYLLEYLKNDPYIFLQFIIYAQISAVLLIVLLWILVKKIFFFPVLTLWDIMEEIVYSNKTNRRIENPGKYEMGSFLKLFNKLIAQHHNLLIDKSIMEEEIQNLKDNEEENKLL